MIEERLEEGSKAYKKGWEVRLVLTTPEETIAVASALETVGIRPGRTFLKYRRIVMPIYGLGPTSEFLKLVS